jgi:valyl-tRNA synthetase
MSLQISNFKIQNDRIPETKTLADQYILLKLNSTIDVVCRLIESFQFSQAGEILRDFTWTELADWYLEIAKIEGNKSEILNYILNTILKLWHPFMPFVTEQIWTEIYSEEKMLMIEKFPQKQNISVHSEVLEDFYIIKNIITGIRSLRAENKIEPAKKLNVSISAGDKVNLLKVNIEIIKGLARVEELNISKKAEKTKTAIGFVESGVEVFVDLFGAIDIEAEKVRLQKEIANVEPYVIGLEKKLNNIEFVNNAPEKVVMIEKKKLVEAQEKLIKLKSQLNSLK